MPTYGEYETYGEPLSVIEERGHISTVWQARKASTGNQLYVVKSYAPRLRQSGSGHHEGTLDKDPGLEFLEGIKQIRKALNEGGRNLTPIHDMGKSATEAWYVTDHYPRHHLHAWIARRGGVDSAALRHVMQSVVAGCLSLKRSRGYSHGNLKPSNVFLVGKPQLLKKTPLVLTDSYPAAPLQLAALDAGDRQEVGKLLDQVVEAQDLRNVGELILQLVEGRLLSRSEDYNYPVQRSSIWDILGKDTDDWLALCNKLLNPQLSLEAINLETLAREFRSPTAILPGITKGVRQKLSELPGLVKRIGQATAALASGAAQAATKVVTEAGQRSAEAMKGAGQKALKVGLALVIAVAVCVIGFGLFKAGKSWYTQAQERKVAVGNWQRQIDQASTLMNETNFNDAAKEFQAASESLLKWKEKENARIAEAAGYSKIAEILGTAKGLLASNQVPEALGNLTTVAPKVVKFPIAAQWVSSIAFSIADDCVRQHELEQAKVWVTLASTSTPNDPRVSAMNERIEGERSADLRNVRWRELTAKPSYQSLRTDWGKHVSLEVFTNILQRDFLKVFTSTSLLNQFVTQLESNYSIPSVLTNLSRADRQEEIAALKEIAVAQGKDGRGFASWKTNLETNYGSVDFDSLALGWQTNYQALTNRINEINGCFPNPGQCNTNDLFQDLTDLNGILRQADKVIEKGKERGSKRASIHGEATRVLNTWQQKAPNANADLAAFYDCSGKIGFDWFSPALGAQFEANKDLTSDPELARLYTALPQYPQKGGLGTVTNQLQTFKAGLTTWWTTSSFDMAKLVGLPLTNVVCSLVAAAERQDSVPDLTSDSNLVASTAKRLKTKRACTEALQKVQTSWTTISNSLASSEDAWLTNYDFPKESVRRMARLDFEAVVTNVSTLELFAKAVGAAAQGLKLRCDTNYYRPPEILRAISKTDRQAELDALRDHLRSGVPYINWASGLDGNYGAVSNMSAILPAWEELRLQDLTNGLSMLKSNLDGLNPSYGIELTIGDLPKALTTLANKALDLESRSQKPGNKRADLKASAQEILKSATQLNLTTSNLQARVDAYKEAVRLFTNCGYEEALEHCPTNGDCRQLRERIANEKREYQNVTNNLAKGDYLSILELSNQFTNNTCFQRVLREAKQENEQLQNLRSKTNQVSNRGIVNEMLLKLLPSVQNKPCFLDIEKWVKRTDPKVAIDQKLISLKVRLDIVNPLPNAVDYWTGKKSEREDPARIASNIIWYRERVYELAKQICESRNMMPNQVDPDQEKQKEWYLIKVKTLARGKDEPRQAKDLLAIDVNLSLPR